MRGRRREGERTEGEWQKGERELEVKRGVNFEGSWEEGIQQPSNNLAKRILLLNFKTKSNLSPRNQNNSTELLTVSS